MPIPFLALAWNFFKNNYQVIILGLMILFIGGYIAYLKVDRNHWKKVAQELQLVINQAKAREHALELGNKAITAKYENSLAVIEVQSDKINKLLKEQIANDKELKSLRVSLNALRLFNASKIDPATTFTGAKQGDDAKAGRPPTFTSDENLGAGITIPLSAIWQQVADNDANHWKCVHQVETWQQFWKDFSDNYNGVAAPGGSN